MGGRGRRVASSRLTDSESQCSVLEQDTLSAAWYWFYPGRHELNDKVLTMRRKAYKTLTNDDVRLCAACNAPISDETVEAH